MRRAEEADNTRKRGAYWITSFRLKHDGGAGWAMIQASKLELRIMRYELTDHEWAAIKPMLPDKPRGVPRVNDRRVLNGIFWVLRSGAPWRDLLPSRRVAPHHKCTGCGS
jgi:hypothetical protein